MNTITFNEYDDLLVQLENQIKIAIEDRIEKSKKEAKTLGLDKLNFELVQPIYLGWYDFNEDKMIEHFKKITKDYENNIEIKIKQYMFKGEIQDDMREIHLLYRH